MKTCIWCLKTEEEVKFNNKAHTIPEKLGGTDICKNVCDKCNSFFGNYYQGLPPVETIIKEAFNITRTRLLLTSNEVGKNKALSRFTSIYFNVDLKRNTINIKPKYKFHKSFQENICRQLKKGIFKIYLEETERQLNKGHLNQYDFIREFARYNIGDYPLFYFERKYGVFYMATDWLKSPKLFLNKESQFKYLVQEPGFFEFELLGHVFGIPTFRNWEITYDNYISKSIEAKKEIFKSAKLVKHFNDIDLLLSIMNK